MVARFARLRRWLRVALALAAVGYPLALIAIYLALRYVGEDWWVTGFALYLPRHLFAIPLPFLIVPLLWLRSYRLLLLQLASLWILLFPLMGLSLSLPDAPATGQPALRLLSYNVNSSYGGARELMAEIEAHAPQLVFLQELPGWKKAEIESLLARDFPHIHAESEFLLASKFPVLSVQPAPTFMLRGIPRSARYLRYSIDTPLGVVTFFNFHTISPRSDFYRTRGQGFRREILSGRLFERAARENMLRTGAERKLQIEAVSAAALREHGPMVIVGDINLPHLSRVRREYLGHLNDGYAEAGTGFGYTFPARFPWMRIDVMLSSEHLRFSSFSVGSGRASDHRAISAVITRR